MFVPQLFCFAFMYSAVTVLTKIAAYLYFFISVNVEFVLLFFVARMS